MFSEQSLRQNPEVVKAFTGIPSQAFWEMMDKLSQEAEQYEQERRSRAGRQRAIGGGRDYEQPLVIRVVALLTYLRLHIPQAAVALLYNCHQSDVSRDLRRLLPLVSRVLPVPDVWQVTPEVAEDVVDELPLERLADGQVLIDATEQRVSRSLDGPTRDQHYSGKRKAYTLKTQVVTDGDYHIQAISEAVPGSLHDKVLADVLDTVQRLPDGCQAFADKGYQGLASQVDVVVILDPATGTQREVLRLSLKTPFKKPKSQDLSPDQDAFNQALGAIRVRVEHCLAWVKNWAVLATRFRCAHAVYTPIFQLVCGLVNAQTHRWQRAKVYCA